METHFTGEMRDKRAICLYCGTEVDLPDSFRRVRKKVTSERQLWGDRTVEETIIETRRDGQLSGEDFDSLPPEVQELLRILKESGPAVLDQDTLQKLQAGGINISINPEAFDPETLQKLLEYGYDIYTGPPLPHSTQTVITRTQYQPESLRRFPFRIRRRHGRNKNLFAPEEILKQAGPPLPPGERRNCPNPKCGAVIPKSAARCPWCSESL
jgi:hypothetical protein